VEEGEERRESKPTEPRHHKMAGKGYTINAAI